MRRRRRTLSLMGALMLTKSWGFDQEPRSRFTVCQHAPRVSDTGGSVHPFVMGRQRIVDTVDPAWSGSSGPRSDESIAAEP